MTYCLRIVTGYVTGYARSAGLTLGRGVVVPFRHISAEASPAAWPIAHPDGVCPVLCTVSVVCCMGKVRSDLRGFVQHLALPDLEFRRETGQAASARPLRGGQNYAVYASKYGSCYLSQFKEYTGASSIPLYPYIRIRIKNS